MIPVAIIDWDGTRPGTRLSNFAEFLWAFVHPAVYGDGEPAARILRVAADAYGWSGPGLVNAMLTTVRNFQPSYGQPGAWMPAGRAKVRAGRRAGSCLVGVSGLPGRAARSPGGCDQHAGGEAVLAVVGCSVSFSA